MKSGRNFEKIVERIMRALAPGAEIQSPGELPDCTMQEPREIDVLVRGSFRGTPVAILIVECRDHKRRVSVGYVESIATKKNDVKADLAFLVSAAGFTKGARQKASAHSIGLFTLKQADLQDWSDWLSTRVIENFSPHVWIHHVDLALSEDAPRELDLSGLVDPERGLNVMTAAFADEDGRSWTLVEVLNRALGEGSFPDISRDGSRRRMTLDINVEALGLTLASQKTPGGRVLRMKMIVDLWRERTVHPLAGLQFRQVGENLGVRYAEATLNLADQTGRQVLPLRFALMQDAEGNTSVVTEFDKTAPASSPESERPTPSLGQRRKRGVPGC